MGNQLLMKKAWVAALFMSATLLHAEITINDIDKLVNDIKQERIGLKKEDLAAAKDPFIYPEGKAGISLKRDKKKSRRIRFVLTAIINDRVKLNNKWYSLNSKIGGYKITEIGDNSVLLAKNSKHVRVYMKRPKSKKIKLLAK